MKYLKHVRATATVLALIMTALASTAAPTINNPRILAGICSSATNAVGWAFLLDASSLVPESSGLALLTLFGAALMRRRRQQLRAVRPVGGQMSVTRRNLGDRKPFLSPLVALRRCPTRSVVLVLGWLMSSAAPVVHAQLIGANFKGAGTSSLFDVNPGTGAATNPRDTGGVLMNGIAFSPGGTLYGISSGFSQTLGNALFTIEPLTGTVTLVGGTGLTDLVEGDLAFHPVTGVLYGGVAAVPAEPGRLFIVNTATGGATIIGPVGTNQTDLSAIEFAADGRLLALESTNDRLLSINPATGAILTDLPLSMSIGSVAGLARHPVTGVMYAVADDENGTDSLYILNPNDGVLTLVGPTGLTEGLAGLAFVPEPSAPVLVAGGILAAVLRRHRKRR